MRILNLISLRRLAGAARNSTSIVPRGVSGEAQANYVAGGPTPPEDMSAEVQSKRVFYLTFYFWTIGAKYGSEHRMSLADAPGRKNSRRKYANETRRYGTLTGADLESIARDIDPRLLDAFRYAFSDARRREVVGDDAACSATSSSRWRGH